MSYLQREFESDVYKCIRSIKGSSPTVEECKAVAHHMEYNIRADRKCANNGHLKISSDRLRQEIVEQIRRNLHSNDIPRYVEQYRTYKNYQKNRDITYQERKDLADIATGKKKVSDFQDKDYLKNLYIKYFNQELLPTIRKISWQEKNHLDYHGIWHTEQVALFAIDISIGEKENPLPSLLAAALHDCARKSDYGDKDHAKNCKPIATNFLDNLYKDRNLITEQDRNQIIHAVMNHNTSGGGVKNPVLDCLQDADSMRLWWEKEDQKKKEWKTENRKKEDGKEEKNYEANTRTGQNLAEYSKHKTMQIRYMASMLERMRAMAKPSTQNTMSRNYNRVL